MEGPRGVGVVPSRVGMCWLAKANAAFDPHRVLGCRVQVGAWCLGMRRDDSFQGDFNLP